MILTRMNIFEYFISLNDAADTISAHIELFSSLGLNG